MVKVAGTHEENEEIDEYMEEEQVREQ